MLVEIQRVATKRFSTYPIPLIFYFLSRCFFCPRMQGSMETPALGLAEAFIAAGARTVVQKLWCDEESALVDTVSKSVGRTAVLLLPYTFHPV